jgi:hypothetical protein
MHGYYMGTIGSKKRIYFMLFLFMLTPTIQCVHAVAAHLGIGNPDQDIGL